MSQKKTDSQEPQNKYPVNLLDTTFPMRGNLVDRERGWLEGWAAKDIYNIIRKARAGKPKFILHDGPPYANGRIHLGHAVNKILKDIIIKAKTLQGFDAPFVLGWDCHGMPIEIQIEKKFGKHLPVQEMQQKARAYAHEQIEQQKTDFKRLGILADWENPYLTMGKSNEANELRALAKMLDKGYIYRGLKPVNWCFDCGSALAEAEVEYQNKIDPSIYCGFEFHAPIDILNAFGVDNATQKQILNHLETKQKTAQLVIWTTTAWTIPANQAINAHPEVQYSLIETDTHYLIIAAELVEKMTEVLGLTNVKIIATVAGLALELLTFKHPLWHANQAYQRLSPIYLADYVTLDSGTGLVHSAPCYGIEDFTCSKKYGLQDDDLIRPVQANGTYIADLALFGGQHINKATPNILNALKEVGSLLHHQNYEHSYMHCWRHKTPIIYRATHQWFASMDKKIEAPKVQESMEEFLEGIRDPWRVKPDNSPKSLRELALAGIEQTQFFPDWGKQRLKSMIANRPDWTLSRQRQWGVPMAFFIHQATGELHPNTPELLEKIAQLIEADGIEAWQNLNPVDLLGIEDAKHYIKNKDTLDVWFDSGTTHEHVLRHSHPTNHNAEELEALNHKLADLYLEGSDQHRGWFHSSLLTASMLYQTPPYKALLTHGFVVDGHGKKMSKSVGNVVAPDDIIQKMGAEMLRLWVASSDYSNDLTISDEILKRVSETYRRIRNTLRFLLANLSDYKHISKEDEQFPYPKSILLSLDQYILHKLNILRTDIVKDYEQYDLHAIVSKLQNFCSEDLGGFYLDIIKDRLYTMPAKSVGRRSAQTALYYITHTLLRLLAPILSFTCEEAWQTLLKTSCKEVEGLNQDTIFVQTFDDLNAALSIDQNSSIWESANEQRNLAIFKAFDIMRELKIPVAKALEEARIKGEIGSSLQAEIILSVPEEICNIIHYNFCQKIQPDQIEIHYFFLVSKVELRKNGSVDDINVTVKASPHAKCERCWHYEEERATDDASICKRCETNLNPTIHEGEYRKHI